VINCTASVSLDVTHNTLRPSGFFGQSDAGAGADSLSDTFRVVDTKS
jgi:hypothetical protein